MRTNKQHQAEWEAEVWYTAFIFAYYDAEEGRIPSDMHDYIDDAIAAVEVDWMSKEQINVRLREAGISKIDMELAHIRVMQMIKDISHQNDEA